MTTGISESRTMWRQFSGPAVCHKNGLRAREQTCGHVDIRTASVHLISPWAFPKSPCASVRPPWGMIPASPRRGLHSADTSTASTIPVGPVRALTDRRRMTPISPRCHQSRWRPDRGTRSLGKRPGADQMNRGGSPHQRAAGGRRNG